MLRNQKGSALLLAIVMFAVLFGLLGMTLNQSTQLYRQVQQVHMKNMALNLAEAGLEFALHTLSSGSEVFGEKAFELETGSVTVSIAGMPSSKQFEIISTGTPKGRLDSPKVGTALKMIVSLGTDGTFLVHSREEIH